MEATGSFHLAVVLVTSVLFYIHWPESWAGMDTTKASHFVWRMTWSIWRENVNVLACHEQEFARDCHPWDMIPTYVRSGGHEAEDLRSIHCGIANLSSLNLWWLQREGWWSLTKRETKRNTFMFLLHIIFHFHKPMRKTYPLKVGSQYTLELA